jgi:ATP-binding cassette, subfamily B, bacterial MsbA
LRRWFVAAVRRYPWHSLGLVVLSVLTSLADGLSVSLLIPFLNTLFSSGQSDASDGGWLSELQAAVTSFAGEGRELLAVSIAIVALVAVRCALGYVEGAIGNWIGGQISCSIRSRIHFNLLKTNFEYLCVNDNARLLNALDGETWKAADAVAGCFGLVTSGGMVLVFTSLLFYISWELTLIVAVLVGLVSVVMLLFDGRIRSFGARTVLAAEQLSERAVELFDAMRMIRAFGREQDAQARYVHASDQLFHITDRSERLSRLAGSVQETLYAVTFVAVVFSALSLGFTGAPLIAYLALLHRLQPHVRALDEGRMNLVSLTASIETVSTLLEIPHWDAATKAQLRPASVKRSIRFEHVTFAYSGKDNESRKALDDVSLEVRVNQMTAIVGWSGAGKSTLTNLLFRFYDPSDGRITIDGTPLQEYDLGWWRGQLAIAGQDADLISGTIRENIAYGKEGASFDEICTAAKQASVHDFILTLPKGYETRIGSRGVLLSGGQRQRIGLARALIRGSGILVLDEATNSLDSMTENEVMKSLEAARGKLTILVIAHRLSTTRMADHVVVLAAGRVAEAGTPQELYRQDGLYAQMVHLQELAQLRGLAMPEQTGLLPGSGDEPTS